MQLGSVIPDVVDISWQSYPGRRRDACLSLINAVQPACRHFTVRPAALLRMYTHLQGQKSVLTDECKFSADDTSTLCRLVYFLSVCLLSSCACEYLTLHSMDQFVLVHVHACAWNCLVFYPHTCIMPCSMRVLRNVGDDTCVCICAIQEICTIWRQVDMNIFASRSGEYCRFCLWHERHTSLLTDMNPHIRPCQ